MKRFLLVAILLLNSSVYSQTLTIFKGRPSIKISEGGSSRTPEKISPSKAVTLECIISKIGDEYFWTSREDTPLSPVESGAFITFVALNGSGYVRVINSELKQTASLMSETEKEFDYTEHLVIGLRSITYYGKLQ